MSTVLDFMRAQPERLYAVVDAARDDEVLTLLYSFGAKMQSLYEGESEARLGKAGPYLVALSSQDDLLKALLRKGWGQRWGIFLTAAGELAEVRRHFRTLLMVKRQSDGSEMYFRFYDPRILSLFLPTCSPEQVRQMFGPLKAFIVESERGAAALRFTAQSIEGERHDFATAQRNP